MARTFTWVKKTLPHDPHCDSDESVRVVFQEPFGKYPEDRKEHSDKNPIQPFAPMGGGRERNLCAGRLLVPGADAEPSASVAGAEIRAGSFPLSVSRFSRRRSDRISEACW